MLYLMVWWGMVWHGMVWCGVCGNAWYGAVWYGAVQYGAEARRRLDEDADYSVAEADCGPAKRHSLQYIIRANNK